MASASGAHSGHTNIAADSIIHDVNIPTESSKDTTTSINWSPKDYFVQTFDNKLFIDTTTSCTNKETKFWYNAKIKRLESRQRLYKMCIGVLMFITVGMLLVVVIMFMSGYNDFNPQPKCKDSEFACVDGKCVNGSYKCNGQINCLDESDEANCSKKQCTADEFICQTEQQCISKQSVCDMQNDCADDSDEYNCSPNMQPKCTNEKFICDDGERVDGCYKCDGQIDCYDESDEAKCLHIQCNVDEFRCHDNQQCIPKQYVCNRQYNCRDNSDEVDEICRSPTKTKCKDVIFTCDDGDRVDGCYRCDGQTDCNDESDEANCTQIQCTLDEFRCHDNQQCVPKQFICNRQYDCKDDSDEDNCPTPCSSLPCLNNGVNES